MSDPDLEDQLVRLSNPPVALAEGRVCLYCPAPLPATSKEHVFNSAWGGRHKSRYLVCDACNGAFSSDVDLALLPLVRYVMNGHNVHGERQRSAPDLPTESEYLLRPYGRPALDAPKVEVDPQPSGSSTVRIQADTTAEATRFVLDGRLDEALGRSLTEAGRRAIVEQIRAAPATSEPVGPVQFNVELDVPGNYRAAVHTALKALAVYEPELARSPRFERARRFARFGEGEWTDYAVRIDTLIDVAEEILDTPGWPLTNAVQLWFDPADGQVVARLTVLGRIVRDVRLAGDYGGPNRTLFVFEPFLGHNGPLPAIGATFGALPGHAAYGLPIRTIAVGPALSFVELGQDAGNVLARSLGPDALVAAIGDGVVQAASRHPTFGSAAADAFRTTFAEALVRLSLMAGTSRTTAEATSILDAEGLTDLTARFEGRPTDDDEVIAALGDLFQQVLRTWTRND